MRKNLLFLFFVFLPISCIRQYAIMPTMSVATNPVSPIEHNFTFKELDGYFLKNNTKLAKNINFFAINTTEKFEQFLGFAKTMDKTLKLPDFTKNIVGIIAMEPSPTANKISILSVQRDGATLRVFYDIVPTEQEIGYFILNMRAFEIEGQYDGINSITFVSKNRKIDVIYFECNSNSFPSDISDALKNFTGTFKGSFPYINGKHVKVVLELRSDYTYTISQEYQTDRKTYTTTGNWLLSKDMRFFNLNDIYGNVWMMFEFIDRKTVERLDLQGRKMNSSLYRLKK
ncbi:MAG: copper resistance protein NlpE [Elusimicrobiota bacterium]|jgi:hypothetical protein|nr:copper resistance protein NlpE [Elusimicrobiota bacterium]